MHAVAEVTGPILREISYFNLDDARLRNFCAIKSNCRLASHRLFGQFGSL
jgi:hypothetical protein